MEYTEQIHASMLLRILSMPHTCCGCPESEYSRLFDTGIPGLYPCDVCRGFIGLNPGSLSSWCPCELGVVECVKRTWIALEEKGYI